MSDPVDDNSTSYLIENCFIEALALVPSHITNLKHFHEDAGAKYPILSVRAVLREEGPELIKYEGEPMEYYDVYITIDFEVLAENEAQELVSAETIDFAGRDIRKCLAQLENTAGIERFSYFEVDPLGQQEKDTESASDTTPTLRVDLQTLLVIAIRAVDEP